MLSALVVMLSALVVMLSALVVMLSALVIMLSALVVMLSIGPGYAGADKRETSRDFASEPATMSS
jgi:hypothetical protein